MKGSDILWFLRFLPGRKKSSVGKIYKTTDGFLRGKNHKNKKPRRVVAVEQRKFDGAIAVAKIYKEEGRDPKSPDYIQDLVLDPKDHSSLTAPSIVEKRAIFGRKDGDSAYIPIFPADLVETGDKLNREELHTVRKGIQNDKKEHRKAYEKTRKRWKKGFKE